MMGKSNLSRIWYYFIIFSCFSCTGNRYAADIEDVLSLAENNRGQLEQVLEHYSLKAEDSLKLRAAEFLIRNMPGKCTETYDAPWENVAAALYRWDNTADKDRLSETYGLGEIKVQEDVHCITAEYLINNIELAFKVWQEQPWGKHISFDTFCGEILPYRVGKEPLENWREKVLAGLSDLNDYFREHPDIDVVEACRRVNRQLPRFTWVGYPVPGMSYSMLMSLPVEFSPTGRKGGCAYLMSMGKEASSIVGWGKVMDGQMIFKDVGKKILYLPVYYTHGRCVPAGYPFRLDDDGKLCVFKPDMKNKQRLTVEDIGDCFGSFNDKRGAFYKSDG